MSCFKNEQHWDIVIICIYYYKYLYKYIFASSLAYQL